MENMLFYLDNIVDTDYIEYIYELLMLIEMLCKNKDKNAIDFVQTQLKFTPKILLKLATCSNIHILYRIAGHHLFMSTCVIAVQGRTSFIQNRFRDM